MLRILFVIPSLDYCGAATQLSLLARGLPRKAFEVRVCALGEGGPLAGQLCDAGVAVEELGWRRPFDLQPYWRFGQCVSSFRPNIIHAWTTPALRMVRFLGSAFARKESFRVVVSSATRWQKLNVLQDWLQRKLLRRADRIVAATCAEAERSQRLGLSCESLTTIAPGVNGAAGEQPKNSLHRFLGLEDTARLIVCIGPLETRKGFYEAIWAFDILHYLYDNLHLVVVGDGPDRGRLADFVRQIQGAKAIHLIGCQPQVWPLLAQADVVWVPSRTGGGLNVALEAMAAGKPVVASRLPDLVELIDDGVHGLLVPPGDKIALARQTRLLINNPARGRELGEAGRQRVRAEFAAEKMTQRHIDLYERLQSGRQQA